MKQLETSLASLNAEKTKLAAPDQAPQLAENGKKIAETSAKLEGLKKSTGGAPQPITDFDKAIKDLQDQITASNNAKPGKQKELENVKKAVADAPKGIADAEKQVADAKTSASMRSRRQAAICSTAGGLGAEVSPSSASAPRSSMSRCWMKSRSWKSWKSDVKGLQRLREGRR